LSNSRPLDYWLLWLVALLSLAVNVWLIRTLLIVRRQAGGAADRAAQAIGALRNSSIDYTVSVALEVPIHLALSDTAFGQSLSDAQGYLERLAVELQRSPFQR